MTTNLVNTKYPKVDSRGLTLIEEFQEQVVEVTRIVVGEQSYDDIDIPRKFPLYSNSPCRRDQRGDRVRNGNDPGLFTRRILHSPRDRPDRLLPRGSLCVLSLQVIVVPSPRVRTKDYRKPVTRHSPIPQLNPRSSREGAQQQRWHEDELCDFFQGAVPHSAE